MKLEELEKKYEELGAEIEKLKKKKEEEVDWSKVPVGQPVLVRDHDDAIWYSRFFVKPGYAKSRYNSRPFRWKQMQLDPDAKPVFNWRAWRGGECPVDAEVRVHIVCRDGTRYTYDSSLFSWDHKNEDSDIMWYAVAQPDDDDGWPGV